jgi:hypothetical protein
VEQEAKLKAEMMNVGDAGTRIGLPHAVQAKCEDLGMSTLDTAKVIDMLSKVQSGRRMVPQRFYRTFRFKPPA